VFAWHTYFTQSHLTSVGRNTLNVGWAQFTRWQVYLYISTQEAETCSSPSTVILDVGCNLNTCCNVMSPNYDKRSFLRLLQWCMYCLMNKLRWCILFLLVMASTSRYKHQYASSITSSIQLYFFRDEVNYQEAYWIRTWPGWPCQYHRTSAATAMSHQTVYSGSMVFVTLIIVLANFSWMADNSVAMHLSDPIHNVRGLSQSSA